MTEWLLNDDSRVSVALRFSDMLHHGFKKYRRDGQVMGWPLRAVELFAKGLESPGILIVAVHVTQQPAQLFKCRRIHSSMFFKAVLGPRAELFQSPTGLGYAYYRDIQIPAFHHRLQRRENLFVGQVACGAEEDQSVGMLITHQ